MRVYKLTNQDNETYNGTKWGENVTHRTDGSGELCNKGWLHFYSSPELGLFLNKIHANICDPKLWEAEAEGQFKNDLGRKGGCTKLTTIREIPVPNITTNQRVAFAILCALEVFKNRDFQKWANNWLKNKDRSKNAANAAYAAYAGVNAAYAGVNAAYAGVNAAYAAVNAADAAAYAAVNAAYAAYAADAAINAADAAAYAAVNAAYAAANAAYAAANAAENAAEIKDFVFDFDSIIANALTY